MELGTEGSGSASLADYVGQQFGDISSGSSEPAASSSTTEGAPPPSDALTPAAGSPPPEGQGTAERPDAPPVAAAPPTPDTPDGATPVVADDPFKDAKPLTYTVDGVERTYDGIKVLGEEFDGRGIIDAANLADIQRRLGERDHLYDANQQQYRTVQHYEKLAEWKTVDAEGKEQTASGPYGLVEMRVAYAQLAAAMGVVNELFNNPERFASLVGVDPATNKIILDQTAWQYLQKDGLIAEQNAERTTRAQLVGLIADLNRPAPQAADYTSQAPRVIEQAAGPGFSKLTPEDRQLLTAQMARYVRDTTPQERQAGQTSPKIVDAGFSAVVQHFVKQREAMSKVATVTPAANASNAANLAAAARGTRPVVKPPVRQPTPAQEQASDQGSAWDLQENAAAAALRRRTA